MQRPTWAYNRALACCWYKPALLHVWGPTDEDALQNDMKRLQDTAEEQYPSVNRFAECLQACTSDTLALNMCSNVTVCCHVLKYTNHACRWLDQVHFTKHMKLYCKRLETRTRDFQVAVRISLGSLQATLSKLLTYCVLRPTQLPTLWYVCVAPRVQLFVSAGNG